MLPRNDDEALARKLVSDLLDSMNEEQLDALASVLLPPVNPISQEAFTRACMRALSGMRGIAAVTLAAPTRFTVALSESVSVIDTARAYDEYARAGDLQAQVDRVAARAKYMRDHEALLLKGESGWKDVQARIFPRLITEAEAADVAGRDVLRLPWIGGLTVTYCEDTPIGAMVLAHRDLTAWGQSLLDVHRAALANLRRRARDYDFQVGPAPDGKLLVQARGNDPYLASILLTPDVLLDVSGQRWLGVGAPERPNLLGINARGERVMGILVDAVRARFAKAKQPFSSEIFILEPGSVSLYVGR